MITKTQPIYIDITQNVGEGEEKRQLDGVKSADSQTIEIIRKIIVIQHQFYLPLLNLAISSPQSNNNLSIVM